MKKSKPQLNNAKLIPWEQFVKERPEDVSRLTPGHIFEWGGVKFVRLDVGE